MVQPSTPSAALTLSLLLQVAALLNAAWIPKRKPLKENHDYTGDNVGRIYSDFDDGTGNIVYSLSGVGADKYPFNVFQVDPKSGFIHVNKLLDREEISLYNLYGVARYKDGTLAEENVPVPFKIEDANDNTPVFAEIKPGVVTELSAAGTSVLKITATDADEPGNKNSQIAYSIIKQDPANIFSIKGDGTVTVRVPPDREAADKYTLIVKAQDLNGSAGGNAATSTVTISVTDVNDNLPTLEMEKYEGSIVENTQGIEVMRFKASDLDVKNTANWEALYHISKGNEANYFSIKTDPVTNEGILMLDKAVNYEDVKDLDLGIAVRNKADAYGEGGGEGDGGGAWWLTGNYKTYPLKINVQNQPEGAAFNPKVKTIPISEGGNSFNINNVIANYPAIDGDTGKPAENVRYVKGYDPGNWLIIDPKTGDIRLNTLPDRESKYLVNGTYQAKVLAISDDTPSQTATGTISIQVEDFNDHCPTLTTEIYTMCIPLDSVIVTAKDEDFYPNGAPFDFSIISEDNQGKWRVEHLNDTSAIVRAEETLWPDQYEVELLVKDEQGKACPEPQKVKVQVCTCEDGVICGKRGANGLPTKSSEFGPAGIGLLFLGLLLLLLVPLLLLFCLCGGAAGLPGGFTEMPFDTKAHLINYRTEGQGENTAVPLINMTAVDGDAVKIGTASAAMASLPVFDGQKSVASMSGMNGGVFQQRFSSSHKGDTWGMMSQPSGSGFYSDFHGRESVVGGDMFNGMALSDHFLGQYYNQKVGRGQEVLAEKDCLLGYDYEGHGSPAGSVGCCSLLECDNDLQFLDDLGPKFRTLAEVCGRKMILTEIESALPSVTNNPHSSVSTAVSSPQLPPPVPPQAGVQTVVTETSEARHIRNDSRATLSQEMARVNTGRVNQSQMLLLQQQKPIYMATTSVVQPVHYVVQPQVQNTMMLAEAPANSLQSMILVNSAQAAPTGSMVLQGQPLLSSGQVQGPGMMLVETNGVQGLNSNLIQASSLSGSQAMMVVEKEVPAGYVKVVKGGDSRLIQGGTLQPGGLSGSQEVVLVGGPVSSGGQVVQAAEGGSQRVHHSRGRNRAGSQSGILTTTSSAVNSREYMIQVAGQGSPSIISNVGGIPVISESGLMTSTSTTVSSRAPTLQKLVVQEKREK